MNVDFNPSKIILDESMEGREISLIQLTSWSFKLLKVRKLSKMIQLTLIDDEKSDIIQSMECYKILLITTFDYVFSSFS